MAIGKKRTRPLTLDGRQFRWRCDFNHPAEEFSTAMAEGRITTPDRLRVRPVDGPHQLLTVNWPPCQGPLVLPELVRACIEEARRRGWLEEHAVMELAGADVPPGAGPD